MKNLRKFITLFTAILFLSCIDNPVEDNRSAQVETLEAEQIIDISVICKGKITDKGTGVIAQYV
jgi:hypothetical protein